MAEHPELWTERTPERRYLFDRPPAFGLAREAERLQQGATPVSAPVSRRKPRRERGPFVTYLRLPWSTDGHVSDLWHRVQCRWGRHDMYGGHTVQLGSTVMFIERRCRWCGGPTAAT